MKVILQQDVKDLGKVGELVKVAPGFARNFLFPRKLASEATEKKVKEWNHLQRVAEVKKKKAVTQRQEILAKLTGTTVVFKVAAGEKDKLFGSITTLDVSKELEKLGYSVDRRDIHFSEQIKVLGQHKATVAFGEGMDAEISILVERSAELSALAAKEMK